MPQQGFSIRLNTAVIAQIQEQYPDFGKDTEKKRGANSEVLRKLIEAGLNSDPKQMFSEELASVKEALRDNNAELQSIRRNFSTLLQLVLRNAGEFPSDLIEETIAELKEKGMLV